MLIIKYQAARSRKREQVIPIWNFSMPTLWQFLITSSKKNLPSNTYFIGFCFVPLQEFLYNLLNYYSIFKILDSVQKPVKRAHENFFGGTSCTLYDDAQLRALFPKSFSLVVVESNLSLCPKLNKKTQFTFWGKGVIKLWISYIRYSY